MFCNILFMIGIVDYNAGNIKSVQRALDYINTQYVISKNPIDLQNCSKVIFPGVGEAKYAMDQLKKTGFDSFLRDFTQSNRPLLGICLGSQIIFDYSQEGDVKCLGLIKGSIKHFNNVLPENSNLKIPHMGWNGIHYTKNQSSLLQNIPENSDFYFVHSYLIQPEDPNIVCAYCHYGTKVPAGIKYNNINAFQFHPEKSGKVGLQILKNFVLL